MSQYSVKQSLKFWGGINGDSFLLDIGQAVVQLLAFNQIMIQLEVSFMWKHGTSKVIHAHHFLHPSSQHRKFVHRKVPVEGYFERKLWSAGTLIFFLIDVYINQEKIRAQQKR